MKLKVGDQVLITGGKDKGKQGKIVRAIPKLNTVVVDGVNMYVKHRKPIAERAGERLVLPRPLPSAKVAIINDKNQPDRIGYQIGKDGEKIRIFKKTGAAVPEVAQTKKK